MRTQFMQAADVFEKFKILGERLSICYEIKPEDDPQYENIVNYIIDGIKAAQQEFGKNLIFIHITGIEKQTESGKTFTNNTTIVPFFNKDISVISNGKQWFLLVDFIKGAAPELRVTEGPVRTISEISF